MRGIFPVVALLFVLGTPVPAGEICGGIAGIPCSDPGDFCLLPDGSCCCDFTGFCSEIPETCPAVYDPVCGCDGVTYDNRCMAQRVEMSVAYDCPCAFDPPTGPLVSLTAFTPQRRLFWNPVLESLGYNVYVDGSCLYHTVPEDSVLLRGDPGPGRVWMFQVTALTAAGEGSTGYTSFCTEREPAAPCICTLPSDVGPCDAAIPRWFHEPLAGQCLEFVWGGCEGNANNFETQAACEAACLDPCKQPAVQGDCTAAIPRWYNNVLSGQCEPFSWGGCGGNANNFASRLECVAACP